MVGAPEAVVSIPLVAEQGGSYHGFRCVLGCRNPKIVPIVVEFVSIAEFLRQVGVGPSFMCSCVECRVRGEEVR